MKRRQRMSSPKRKGLFSLVLLVGTAIASGSCGGSSADRLAAAVTDDEGGPPTFDRSGFLPDPLTAPFGISQGAFAVDRSGSATYRLAIDVPPGRAGLEPELALTYTSSGGQGFLGMGFSLAAVSHIERCRKTSAEDGNAREVTFLRDDALCWNGNRLIEVAQTRFESGIVKEYRTRHDQNARIVAYGPASTGASDWEPERLEVETADGRIHQFGTSAASRWASSASWNATFAWLLDETRDRFGNTITYSYSKHTPTVRPRLAAEDVEVLLQRIVYSGHQPTGLAGAQAIDFTYVDDPNTDFIGYRHGMLSTVTRVLDKIQMSSGGQLTWRYDLDYRRSAATGRSLLESIRKCSQGSGCLDAITFEYDDPVIAAPAGIDITPIDEYDRQVFRLADIDGDGRADFVRQYPAERDGEDVYLIDVAFSQAVAGTTSNPFPTFTSTSVELPFDDNAIVGLSALDFDRDGRTDFMHYMLTPFGAPSADHPFWRLVQSTGTDFTTSTLMQVSGRRQVWADYNGDGRPDLASCLFDDDDGQFMGIALNVDGINLDEYRVSSDITQACGGGFEGFNGPLDFDGDGAADLVINTFPRLTAVEMVEDAVEVTIPRPGVTPGGLARNFCGPGSLYCPQLMDFNGDGLVDIMVANYRLLGQNAIYYGTGTGYAGTPNATDPDFLDGFPFPNGTYSHGPSAHISYNRESGASIEFLPEFATVVAADFNLDGREDFLRPGGAHSLEVLLSSGLSSSGHFGTWRQTVTLEVPDEGEPVRFSTVGDVDGNGAVDVVTWTGQRHMLYLFDQPRPDLLVAVNETPQAETYRVSYAALSDPSVYDRSSCSAGYPTRCAAGSAQTVVRTVDRDAGPDQARRIERYQYRNGKTNVAGLGWVGFEAITRTDDATGAVEVTTYDLGYYPQIAAYPFRDLPTGQTVTMTVEDIDAPGGIEHVAETSARPELAVRANGTYITWLGERTSTSSYGGQLLGQVSVVIDQVDAYGNPTDWRVLRADETITTGRRVVNDVFYWALGLPEYESIESQTPGETRTRHRAWGWDEQHAVLEWSSERFGASGDDPLRTTVSYAYDAYGNVEGVTVEDGAGNQRHEGYLHDDPQHMFPQQVTDAVGTTQQRFDLRYGTLRRRQTPGGVITRYAHDGFGRLVVEEDGDATVTRRQLRARYDTQFGYFRIDTDSPRAPTMTDEIDRLGRRFRSVRVAFDESEVEERTYFDRFGRVREEWTPTPVGVSPDPAHRRRLGYDRLGRVTLEVDLGGGYTVHDYDASGAAGGLTVHSYDPRGHGRQQVVDAAGRAIRQVDALGGITHYRYGAFSRLREVEDPEGNLYVAEHDAYGLRTSIDEPDSGITRFDYTPFGDVEVITHADGATTAFQYDAAGRIEERVESDGDVTVFEWDSAPNGVGLLASATGPDGHAVEYAYDWAQRLRSQTFHIGGDSHAYELGYDDEGRSRTIAYPVALDGSRLTVRHEYRNGFLSGVVEDGTNEAFWARLEATPAGQTSRDIYGNGVRTDRTYTPWGGLAGVRQYGGHGLPRPPADFRSARYDYDQNRNLIGRTDLMDSWQERFEFDPLDRLTSACIDARTDIVSPPPRADGRPAAPPRGGNTPTQVGPRDGIVTDPPLAIGTDLGNRLAISTSNAVDNRLVRSFGTAQVSAHDWRARGAQDFVVPGCESTEYDPIGNIEERSDVGDYVYDVSFQEVIEGPSGPQVRTRVLSHAVGGIKDANGGRSYFTYDARGRLRENGAQGFEWRNAGLGSITDVREGWSVEFEYGPSEERARKITPLEVTTYAGAFQRRATRFTPALTGFLELPSTSDHHFIHADGRVVAEVIRHTSGISRIEAGFGEAGEDLGIDPTQLGEHARSMEGGRLSNRYTLQFYHHDHIGSVELITGPLGHAIEARSYDPWGRLRLSPANGPIAVIRSLWATQQPVGFTSHEHDEEFGLINMRGRMYDPKLGRMLSPDPEVASALHGQGLNRYSYALNNPVSLIDPTGFLPKEPGGPRLGGADGLDVEPGGPKLPHRAAGTSAANPIQMPDLVVSGAPPPQTPTGGSSTPPAPAETPFAPPAGRADTVDPLTRAARDADLDLWQRALLTGVVHGVLARLGLIDPRLGLGMGMAIALGNDHDAADLTFVFFDVPAARIAGGGPTLGSYAKNTARQQSSLRAQSSRGGGGAGGGGGGPDIVYRAPRPKPFEGPPNPKAAATPGEHVWGGDHLRGSPFESWTADRKVAEEFARRRGTQVISLDLRSIDPSRIAADLRTAAGRAAAAAGENAQHLKNVLLHNLDAEVVIRR